MHDMDVNGPHNVLEAAGQAGTQRVLVASSAVAYRAFPGNPVTRTENVLPRDVSGFSYARDKTESGRICQLWAAKHTEGEKPWPDQLSESLVPRWRWHDRCLTHHTDVGRAEDCNCDKLCPAHGRRAA